MNIFRTLTAGDSASWCDIPWLDSQQSTLLTSADWVLTYQLRGPTQLELVAVPDGDGWKTTLSTVASATLSKGTYIWAAYLTRPDERKTAGGGTLLIRPDLSQIVVPLDGRSKARKALEDCEEALASFKSSGGKVKSYTIGSRQTEFHSLADLMMVRDFWQRKVNNEIVRRVTHNGGSNPRHMRVRFER